MMKIDVLLVINLILTLEEILWMIKNLPFQFLPTINWLGILGGIL
jgi:hypothetical protein